MTLETFTPAKPPSYNSTLQVVPRVLETPFGDGYKQRAGDGLNDVAETWDLTWAALLPADADTIEAFFVARAGREAFWWTPPRGGSAKKYVCTKWSRALVAGNADRMTATLVQDFTLGA